MGRGVHLAQMIDRDPRRTWVVVTEACPSNSWTTRMSAPPQQMCREAVPQRVWMYVADIRGVGAARMIRPDRLAGRRPRGC